MSRPINKKIERFTEIMEEINNLIDEAEDLLPPSYHTSIRMRAQSYWIPQIKGTVRGRASMHSMHDTLLEMKELASDEW